jgi:hypothetical protein
MEFTKKEIKKVIDEYYNEHTVVGTKDKPVVIDERTAVLILESRRRKEEFINSVDDSHDMNEWHTDVRAPVGTARFYSVRQCRRCGYEQGIHAAGRYIDPWLKRRCPELPPIKKDYEI